MKRLANLPLACLATVNRMFETIETAPADPILGLTAAFRQDSNPEKINLGVGVYQDAEGRTPVLESVKAAEAVILHGETSKGYLPIAGSPEYARAVQELMFTATHEVVRSGRVATSQTPGGTGALRVVGNFLQTMLPKARIWMSEPTWPNHPKIFGAAGVEVQTYPYFDAEQNGLAFDKMLAALETIPAGDVVLLHGCCHNPSGIDPSAEQWQAIAEVVHRRGLLPLVDFAYQGFGEGLREDAVALEALCQAGREMLICSSFSKNFGLYRERVGALSVVAADRESATRVQSQVMAGIRANYSNPPSHGAAVVTTIHGDPQLHSQWEAELRTMRQRINGMRTLFVETLQAKGVDRDFSFITRQRGMFSFSGLTRPQVDRLREEYSIYIVGSGRINVAGMTAGNMDRLCDAIATVLKD